MRTPRLRLRLDTFMIWSFVLAMVLALVAQKWAAERREQTLKARFAKALAYQYADENRDRTLGDLGIVILKEPTGAELLRVSMPKHSSSGNPVVTPTGYELDMGVAARLGSVLLDRRNYGYLNGGDDSEPQVGLRVRRGEEWIDILISLEGSSPTSPRQFVWVEVHGKGGKSVHQGSLHCLHDPTLQKLAEGLTGLP